MKKSNKLLAVFLTLTVVILFISIYCIAISNEVQNQSPDLVVIVENNQLSIVDDIGRHGGVSLDTENAITNTTNQRFQSEVVSLDNKKYASSPDALTYVSSEVASLEVFPIFFILLAAICITALFFSGYKFIRNSNISFFCAAPGI